MNWPVLAFWLVLAFLITWYFTPPRGWWPWRTAKFWTRSRQLNTETEADT